MCYAHYACAHFLDHFLGILATISKFWFEQIFMLNQYKIF